MTPTGAPIDLRQLFENISIPRLAGSKNCDDVVARLADVLGKKGYRGDCP